MKYCLSNSIGTDKPPILERFAPYTKLFLEKEWNFSPDDDKAGYAKWKDWIAENHPKVHGQIEAPIDILIATDALSEGQNLQDVDMVINYDNHWNPVRIIQRMGRIDRLGSPNSKIFGVNFSPSNNINTYLRLQSRIEERMAAMKLGGAEVNHRFSDSFREMMSDDPLDQQMRDRMLRQMEVTLDDLDGEQTLGLDDLSLERFRQDLLAEFNLDRDKYRHMPNGVYTGFLGDRQVCAKEGLIALMGYPSRPPKATAHEYLAYDLITWFLVTPQA